MYRQLSLALAQAIPLDDHRIFYIFLFRRVFVFDFFLECKFFFAQPETVPGILCKEHRVHVSGTSATHGCGTKSIPVGEPDHRLATKDPFTFTIIEAALRKVPDGFTIGTHQSNFAVSTAGHIIIKQQPLTIRAPLKIFIILTGSIELVVIQYSAGLFARKVKDIQRTTILDICDLLTIRTILGLSVLVYVVNNCFFINQC